MTDHETGAIIQKLNRYELCIIAHSHINNNGAGGGGCISHSSTFSIFVATKYAFFLNVGSGRRC